MYVQKSVDSQWGIPITYWAINNVTIVFAPRHTMTITYAGWANKEAHDAGAEPMALKNMDVSTVTDDPKDQAIQAAATDWLYSLLLKSSELEGGELVS